MKVVSKVTGWQVEGRRDASPAGVLRSVYRAVHHGRLAAPILHHVYLATLRPVATIERGSKHPERGPDALTHRKLHPRFDTTEVSQSQALGLQPGGCVTVGSRLDADHQMSVAVEMHVVSVGSVRLQFAIAPPAVVAKVIRPSAWVRERSRRPVELVGPRC